MAERSHLSIGEVLSLLREEFPDITISKIRFLESQGLVDPERTPSGYRKFYDHDVERLRWILRQQREHFLPLKVIRGRLTEQEAGEAPGGEGSTLTTTVVTAEAEPPRPEPPAAPEPGPRRAANGPLRPPPPVPSLFAGLHNTPEPARPRQEEPPAPDETDTFSAEELAEASGMDPLTVHELKQYGLIAPHAVVAGVQYYDTGALSVCRAAAQFSRHGVEARHLRMWRNAADREADLFQQVVLPLLRQRNPQARRQALETLDQLSSAGAALRSALVERAIREIR